MSVDEPLSMIVGTFTFKVTRATGIAVPNTNAGGGLEPLPDGSYYKIYPGAVRSEGARKRPHLRLIPGGQAA